ncbi:hypothetical protein CA54_37090 [Symmachiella macrocystis]|uniref:Uncharacterized protein n=1 Tax=Symmachiella macrocystis TaxID=2527985 RepID=A0A5C6BVZ2_9PLAN|nr:hypothetical protein CA54_37090 [Symmachiella macrocystis]
MSIAASGLSMRSQLHKFDLQGAFGSRIDTASLMRIHTDSGGGGPGLRSRAYRKISYNPYEYC